VNTTSTYKDSRQSDAYFLAVGLVTKNFPLNGTAFGSVSPTPVFFSDGAAVTGQQQSYVAAGHLLLVSAGPTGPSTGKVSVVPVPRTAFHQVSWFAASSAEHAP
jgi:hypothetical protein